MVTTILLLVLQCAVTEPASQPDLLQIRPGSFRHDPQKAAEADAMDTDRLSARDYIRAGSPSDALRILSRWRDKVRTPDGKFVADYFFQAHVMLNDWSSALAVAQDQYDAFSASKSVILTFEQVRRLATCLYIVGKKEQAWQLCQAHKEMFNTTVLSLYLKKYEDKPITRADLGDALLRASASDEGAEMSMYYYWLLVRERPNDAEAHYLLSRSLPSDDLMSRRVHMSKAVELAEGEQKKTYLRKLDDINSLIKMREKRSGGLQSSAISVRG